MRFSLLRHAGEEGLPVLPEIPDHRLSTIEGRNGIGKTLAARLLELVTGGHPFAALPSAWQSLCTDLGKLSIEIVGFPSGERVRCELDSSSWIGRSEADCALNPGTAYIDDREVDWASVRRLLAVRRIAGDEGLSETLGRTLRESSVLAYQRYAEVDATVDRMGAAIAETFVEDFTGLTESVLLTERDSFFASAVAVEEASTAREEAEEVQVALRRQLAAWTAVWRATGVLPDLLDRYRESFAQQQSAQKAMSDAEAALTEAGRQQKISKDRQEELDHWTRLLGLRLRGVSRSSFDEQQALMRLNLDERPTDADIVRLEAGLRDEIGRLEEQNRTDDLAGTIRIAQEGITAELRRLPIAAQDEAIATLGRPVSAGELADGITARRRELEGIPKPGEVTSRERRVRKLRDDLYQAGRLPTLFAKADQKALLVDEAVGKITEIEESFGGVDDARRAANEQAAHTRARLIEASVAARDALAVLEETLLPAAELFDTPEAGVQLAATEVSTPGFEDEFVDEEEVEDEDERSDELPSPDAVTDRIGSWLQSLSQHLGGDDQRAWTDALEVIATNEPALVDLARIADRERRRVEEAEAAAAEVVKTARAVEALREEDHRRAAELLSARLERLRDGASAIIDERGPWQEYQEELGHLIAATGLDHDRIVRFVARPPSPVDLIRDTQAIEGPRLVAGLLESIVGIVDEIEGSAARVRDAWATAALFLGRVSAELSPRLSDAGYDIGSLKQHSLPLLEDWAESTLSRLLSAPELRSELFANADTVAFNLSDHTVAWVEKETSRRRRRPVEAFSSGEQVFAYTRAKLEQLRGARAEAQNVVVFLDEFGAFVARDRFAQLMAYIEHDALGEIADQIIVTLPLSADLDQVALAANARGLEAAVFDNPGYAVIPTRSAAMRAS